MTDRTYNVLFLCTGNSARSVIGEAIMNKLGGGQFVAYSAGSQPAGSIHQFTRELLQTLHYPVDTLRSKSWDEFTRPGAPVFDFVFTVCDSAAAETCPVWPGQPISAHWGVPDPAKAEGTETEKRLAFAEAYRLLNNRISAFISLPLSSLERLSLQRKLDDIGKL